MILGGTECKTASVKAVKQKMSEGPHLNMESDVSPSVMNLIHKTHGHMVDRASVCH